MIFLTFLTALALSGVAAYYSVIGLAAIFPGSFWPIIIMGSVLEGAKLVTVSWLYRNWKVAHIGMKAYLTAASVILMLITSMGIFGYLSKAHLEHSADSAPLVAKVQLLDEKIRVAKENLDANRKIIKQFDEQVDQTMGRSSDEKGIANSVSIRRNQQKERNRIQTENETYQKTIAALSEEKFPLQNQLATAESDFGPIKYVAELIYGSGETDIIDKAVRLVIMLIMVVFDPLAVLLLIAANISMTENKRPVSNKVWDDFMKGRPTEIERQPEHVGIVAQEVANVAPEIVATSDESGMVSVDYNNLNSMMIKAIQELQENKQGVDKFAYLKQPFVGFGNLKPMPAPSSKPVEPPTETVNIDVDNVIVIDELGNTIPPITKYDYDEPYTFREKGK
jgi:hypothetical protein